MSERARTRPLWDPAIAGRAAVDALKKLDPRAQFRNPVMFIVEVGSLITTIVWAREVATGSGRPLFTGQVALWLWFTVIFANFAEALAEGRGKAQAATLRRARTRTRATRLDDDGSTGSVPAESLRKHDLVVVKAGEIVPADGEVMKGAATVD